MASHRELGAAADLAARIRVLEDERTVFSDDAPAVTAGKYAAESKRWDELAHLRRALGDDAGAESAAQMAKACRNAESSWIAAASDTAVYGSAAVDLARQLEGESKRSRERAQEQHAVGDEDGAKRAADRADGLHREAVQAAMRSRQGGTCPPRRPNLGPRDGDDPHRASTAWSASTLHPTYASPNDDGPCAIVQAPPRRRIARRSRSKIRGRSTSSA